MQHASAGVLSQAWVPALRVRHMRGLPVRWRGVPSAGGGVLSDLSVPALRVRRVHGLPARWRSVHAAGGGVLVLPALVLAQRASRCGLAAGKRLGVRPVLCSTGFPYSAFLLVTVSVSLRLIVLTYEPAGTIPLGVAYCFRRGSFS